MAYELRIEAVDARMLVGRAVNARLTELPCVILLHLRDVWRFLRTRKVRTGPVVVIYRDGPWNLEIGVEVFAVVEELRDFQKGGVELYNIATPAGNVVATTHWGSHAELRAAHAALRSWCVAAGRPARGPSWEVYADRSRDLASRRTTY